MQMFLIAQLLYADFKSEIRDEKREAYLCLESNNNICWSIHKETATQFTHEEAENILHFAAVRGIKIAASQIINSYIVEAVRTNA